MLDPDVAATAAIATELGVLDMDDDAIGDRDDRPAGRPVEIDAAVPGAALVALDAYALRAEVARRIFRAGARCR